MFKRTFVVGACVFAAWTGSVLAGIKIVDEEDKNLEVGARIQLQYLYTDPDGGQTIDELFFRRLRPYLQGSVTRNWAGRIEFDFGETLDDNELQIKDAFIRYTGFKLGAERMTSEGVPAKVEGLALYFGSTKTTFARSFLTSSKRLRTVERGFTGGHNFGTPDRQIGVRFDGRTGSSLLVWGVTAGFEDHDPDARRIDFDNPANQDSDWNQGRIIAARLDLQPMGEMKAFDEVDFHTDKMKVDVGVAGYAWSNDGDNNTYTDSAGNSLDPEKADLDSAEGAEVSVSLRGHGIAVDADYQVVRADTVAPGFTGGVYVDGETQLDKAQIGGGYMFPGNRFEVAASWNSLDADGYAKAWTSSELDVNWYINRHDTKLQLTVGDNRNLFGVDGDDTIVSQLQLQFVW